jgi:hypothetical protein
MKLDTRNEAKTWLLVLGILALLLAWGCDDDSSSQADAAPVDVGLADLGEASDAAPDSGLHDQGADAQLPPVLGAGVLIFQLQSDVPGQSGFLLDIETNFEDADAPQMDPDYGIPPAPPNCRVYTWGAMGLPNMTTGDAGEITIEGHEMAEYASGTGTGQTLPQTITCTRHLLREAGGTTAKYAYDCGLGASAMLKTEAILDTTRLDIAATGGEDVEAFSATDSVPGPVVTPDAEFDLNDIDPGQGFEAKWQTPAPSIVSFSISARDANGTQFALLTCSGLGVMKSKAIPADALDLLPKPAADNPVELKAAIVGFDPAGAGKPRAGIGRGHFGVTCLSTTGATPGYCN